MEPTTILFAPLSAWGHINSCLQIAKVLQSRHNCKIIFITNETWAGKLVQYNFRHETYATSTAENNSQPIPSQNWTDLVKQSGQEVMGQSSLQKITTFGYNAYKHMVDEVIQSDSQIKQILETLSTIKLIVIDNYILSPSLVKYCVDKCIPWVRLRSASPMEINQTNLPPQNSGYSIKNPDLQAWDEFTQKQTETFSPLVAKFSTFFKEIYPPQELPLNDFIMDSPHLNLYMYPQSIDYTGIRPMPAKWERINAVVQDDDHEDEGYKFPEGWLSKSKNWKVICLSLGTFGSADLELMTNLIKMLAEYPAYFIVCTGPHHDTLKPLLGSNMSGESILPQVKVLAKIDAMICHGGNATVNECFYFGRPMILMPFFGDEYDNAQRVHEEGLGIRLDPYKCTKNELFAALGEVTGDEMMDQMKLISSQIRQEGSGADKAASLISELLKTYN